MANSIDSSQLCKNYEFNYDEVGFINTIKFFNFLSTLE